MMFDSADAFSATVDATVLTRDGGSQAIKCVAGDREKLHGATVNAVKLEGDDFWRVFVLKKPNGELTSYTKSTGKDTDGMSLFHYIDSQYKSVRWSRCHLKDNDWTNMTRSNWETAANARMMSPAERRYQKLGIKK